MNKRLLLSAGLVLGAALFFIDLTPESPKKVNPQQEYLDLPPLQTIEIEEQKDQPHLALLQEFEMTKDPTLGYPPTQRVVNAYSDIKDFFAKQPRLPAPIAGVEWTERGSNNIGGRTRTLMFDPNDPEAKKVWAGSVGGGLWYINDITSNASIWQQEPDIMTNLAISSLTYDPTNTQTFYLGTGQGYTNLIPGAGIWKSTDAGDTWNQLASTANNDFFFIQKLKVTDQGTVLASTTTGLQRSIDGGATWTNIFSGRWGDIEIASDGTIYASQGVNSQGAVYKSTNDGVNWTDITPQTGGSRTELAIAPSNPNIIYAVADGGVGSQDVEYFRKSTDGGETWEDITIPLYTEQSCSVGTNHYTRGQAWFDLILAVHPENPDIIIAGGIDLNRSVDGGQTWELITYWTGGRCDEFAHADQHEIQFRPGHPNSLIAGNDGGIDYSPDAGNAEDPDFERRVKGYNTMLFYYAAMVNEIGSNIMLAGAQDNGTQRFTQVGVNETHEATGGDGAFCFIDPNNPDIQIASFVRNVYFLSTDGGLTFSTISGDQNTGLFINPTDVDFQSGTLYSSAGPGQIGRISGIPNNPSNINYLNIPITNRISSIKVSPYTENRIFVGTNAPSGGRIFMIDDAVLGTPTVTEITGNLDITRGNFLRSIDIGASDDQLLITFSNFGATSIYETQDGGTTWFSKEDNLPDIPVRWAIYNPNNRNQAMIATNLGVWSTDNLANPGWEPVNNGLASTRVDHLLYRPADELVAAATHGRGLFTTDVFASTVKADFKTDQIVGYTGVPVKFEDASLLPSDSWSWDFGDGSSSTSQNPEHTYTTPGTYDVSLTIANGANTETKSGYVTILPVRSTPYMAADGGDFESNPEHFTSRSLRNGVNLWERGEPGNALTQVNSGTTAWKTKLTEDITDLGFDHRSAFYTPAFDLSDPEKDYTLSFRLSMETVFCNLPISMQTHYSIDGGINWQTLGTTTPTPGNVNWYNRGPNTGCSINGDIFEDKMGWTLASSTQPNGLTQTKLNFLIGQPNVSFRFVVGAITGISSSANPYDVDGFMIDDFEVLATDPTADFDANVTSVFPNEEIQFSYISNGADSFLWDFGDGNSSTTRNPVHSYSNSGTYTVSLTITDNGNQITETKTDFITVLAAKAVPYTLEDGGNFEVNTDDFVAINNAGTPFELGVSGIDGKDGTVSGNNVWVTDRDAIEYLDNSDARLQSPLFDFSADGKIYTLEFKAKFSFEPNWDGFIVNYSIDNGDTWIKLNNNLETGWYNQITDPQAIFGAEVPIFSGSTEDEFLRFSTDVTFLHSQNVIFEFRFRSDANVTDTGLAIDDFQILLSDPGPISADFTVQSGSGCAGQEVIFTNTSTGNISSYEWNFGANASPATASGSGPHTVTYTDAGLSSVTLSIADGVGQTDSETKADLISTGALHTPTFFEENNGDRNIARLIASDGDAYQWFFNGTAINGATDKIYLADLAGNYAVDVTINGCTARAEEQNIITSTEENRVFGQSIVIFPNPVKETLKLQMTNNDIGQMTINLFDASGSNVLTKTIQKDSYEAEYQILVNDLNSGIYMLEIISDRARSVKRVVKE